MENKIIVETSARHVHLTEADIEVLFGKGATLTFKKPLSQPGQFASEERVTIQGSRNSIKNVIILGPARPATQVEISLTDARTLGVDAPIRESGDVKGSGSIKIIGTVGEIDITEGVIAAKRHIHLTPEAAAELDVTDKEIVSIKLDTQRSLVFGDVVVRVNKNFSPAIHIDTDESNAAAVSGTVYASIIK